MTATTTARLLSIWGHLSQNVSTENCKMDSKRILVLETMILTFGLILILGHCVTEASEPPRVQGLNERHETNSIRSNANSEAHDPDNLSADHRPPSCREAASHEASDGPPSVEVAKWNWHHVGLYLTITIFIVLSGLAKVGESVGHQCKT